MKSQLTNADGYLQMMRKTSIVFNSANFNSLNANKVERVDYLIIKKENSPRFSLIFGIKDSTAQSPFSAPFSMPEELKKESSLSDYDEALEAVDEYAIENGLKKLRITLPPLFYAEDYLSGWLNAFYRKGYTPTIIDVNYAIDLSKAYSNNYEKLIQYNGRRNLRIALSYGSVLRKCKSENEIKAAYNIIEENRASKGYPLRMTYKQICDTIKIVDNDIFIMSNNDVDIAAALVYRVAEGIAQVIYWGDKPGYSNLKPINYLSFQLIQYYGNLGFQWLDIGPSTEDSLPNYGLCDFKESIGCQRSVKLTLVKEYSVVFKSFNREFLELSSKWLNDPETKALTMTPDFMDADQERWFSVLSQRKDYLIWGVEYKGTPIGVVGIKYICCDSGEYFGYIGEKEFRYRGIGMEMVRFAQHISRKKGLKTLCLHVGTSNTVAHKLYVKSGFIETNIKDNIISMEIKI